MGFTQFEIAVSGIIKTLAIVRILLWYDGTVRGREDANKDRRKRGKDNDL
jgi:hypothetical protein